MAVKKRNKHLDRILGRLDDLDSVNLTILVQRLARERHLLETVIDAIQEGILVINRGGTIEYANEAAAAMLGLEEDEIGTAVLWKLMPDLARTINLNLDYSQSTFPSVSRELEVTYPKHRFVRLYLVPFTTEEENTEERFAVLLSDITEEKVSTEELIVNERLSSIFDLAAGVAHEIGNPLNSINIHLQLIKRKLKALEEQPALGKISDSVDICVGEVERLDGIITHFLQALRPQPLQLQDVQLLEILTDVIHIQENELKGLGIDVDVEIKEALPIVSADPDQIKQIYFNVIKNAMEAMDQGGELKITTRGDDEFVYIHIADTGVGIEQEDLTKIFNPYYTNKSDGHGLGMMIVQRIMRAHGGQIGIDSRPGTGTVVTLQFPQKHRRIRMLEQSSD